MAWGRLFECMVAEDVSKVTDKGTLISDLHMTFKVTRSVKLGSPAKAELVVYNASPDTRARLKADGMNLSISAGYADQGEGLHLIFCGNITQSIDSHIGTEWQTKISASGLRNAGRDLKSSTIALTYGKNISLGQIIDDIANAMGMVSHNTARAYQIKRSGGFAFHGRPTDALQTIRQQLEANQISIYIDLNTICTYEPKVNSKMEVIYLNKSSGLMRVSKVSTVEEQAAALHAKVPKKKPKPQDLHEKLKFESLLISALQPNGLVYISASEAEGAYLIEELTHEGDNFGGDWKSTGEVIR